MLKSYGVVVVVVAHLILGSPLGPNPSFFLFLGGTFIRLGCLLGQGLGLGLGLGPGLDNYSKIQVMRQLLLILLILA